MKRVGEKTYEIVRQYVDEIVDAARRADLRRGRLDDAHAKLVPEGAAAAPVGALLHGLVKAPAGSKVVCVLSGGNVNLDQLQGLKWN